MTRPIVCLVTDRRRVANGGLLALFADAADAGVDLIQIREPDLPARQLHALVTDAVRLTRGSSTRVVVNDRADVALAAGADGVHVPASGPPTARVRVLGPAGWLVGRSAHTAPELDAAADADYVIFGTVYATDSKPGVVGQGVRALADAARRLDRPVLAIGGVSLARLTECAAAGAAGVAAISLFLEDARGGLTPRDAVHAIRQAFRAD
jgi:thiamine-phosphate diphosphorylase